MSENETNPKRDEYISIDCASGRHGFCWGTAYLGTRGSVPCACTEGQHGRGHKNTASRIVGKEGPK